MKLLEDAAPVVRWLGSQQKVGGGYGSTQVIYPLMNCWTLHPLSVHKFSKKKNKKKTHRPSQ